MQKTLLPELLSPAGSMESIYAAVNNGCDAIYVGGKQFSARQYANNFSIEELEQACDYCHLRGIKLYVTVNTLYKQKELENLLNTIGDHVVKRLIPKLPELCIPECSYIVTKEMNLKLYQEKEK